ncbi:PepSY-associated TM helix domain-containing protein [Roseiterribacter gracilis]|uniref:PepSY domain-containing protein n=1 Tax=Roseiterribacter gracilis TaxID=2812848 RepID=A0A8S8XEV8_9PROT|nr:hypothetical protein TMPK1_19020 [Rhodospirillales bacterium TMPK1]
MAKSFVGRLRPVHRWLSIAVALFWLLQALSGALLVFHVELDDARLGDGTVHALDAQALGHAIAAIEQDRPGEHVRALYATGGVANRFDLYVTRKDGKTDLVRIDGAGTVLRTSPSDYEYGRMSLYRVVSIFHQELFLGDLGTRIVGLSGLLLFTNLALGLRLAWPHRKRWRAALLPSPAQTLRARLYAWHRAIGLWGALPAFVLVTAGILLAFASPIRDRFGIELSEPARTGITVTAQPDATARAIEVALQRHPGAALSSLRMPRDGRPWYRVRVRVSGEWHRTHGQTTMFVGAADGNVVQQQTLANAPFGVRFFESALPVHTGEAAGWAGRVLSCAVGLWLATMVALGVAQFLAGRRARRS